MDIKFNDLNLNDSELLSVLLSRDDRGDLLELKIDYILDYDDASKTETKTLSFINCYSVRMNFNLAITPQSIWLGEIIDESPEIEEIKSKFKSIGGTISNTVKHYSIELNTSASTIHVVAEHWDLRA